MTALIHAPSTSLAIADRPWLDRALYPFAPRQHRCDEGTISYVDEGRGRPILFVHGTPSWSFEWRAQITSLSATRRCIAPDHLGFGLSDKPTDAAYEPADHARRLLALVRALDLTDLTLVLHDFGGPIGLPLLLEEPARVRSLVLMNTWAWPSGDDPSVRRISRFVASPLGRFLYLWLNASPRWLVPASFGDRTKLPREVHRHYVAPFGRRDERRAPWALGCALAGADPYYASLWERRESLTSVPATIVWGMRDPAFGPKHLARWRDALPSATVIELDRAGHFPQEEAPAEVTEAIRAA